MVAVVGPPRYREELWKGRDAQRLRRALLPLDGVAVFAQGIRTMTLLRKKVR